MNYFDPPNAAEQIANMRASLAYLKPDTADDVRMVAAALKTSGALYEEAFLDWAKPFGRYKAKGLWAKARPDPDAIMEVAERQFEAANRRNRFDPLTAAQLGGATAPAYRIKGVFPAEGLAVIYGASASGKSFLATAAAAAIAAGTSFFDLRTMPAHVLYVMLEGEAGLKGRVHAWERQNGPMSDRLAFVVQPFNLTDANDVADLAAMCPRPCVIFIDTLNRAAPGVDENSSKDMGIVIDRAKQLQVATGGLIVLIAHTGKDASKGLRGHSSLFAAIDAAILVTRDGESRRWKVDKAKDGKDGTEFGFRLRVVELGTDDDGDKIESCVVEPDEFASTGESKPLTGNRRLALATLHEAAPSHGVLAADGSLKGVPIDAWRTAFYNKSPADNEPAKRKAFGRARADLIEMRMIEVDGEHYRFSGPNAQVTNELVASNLRDKGTKAGHWYGVSQSLWATGQDTPL
jgi:hypothetical protein